MGAGSGHVTREPHFFIRLPYWVEKQFFVFFFRSYLVSRVVSGLAAFRAFSFGPFFLPFVFSFRTFLNS